MSIAKKVAGQSSWFLIGNVFTLLVGFLFQVYLARQLQADGLGVFGLLEVGAAALTGLLGFGIAQVMLRFVPEHVSLGQYVELHALIRGGFLILLVTGMVAVVLIFLALPMLLQQWPQLAGHESEVMVASFIIPLGLLLFASTQALRGFHDVRFIVIGSSIIQLIVKIVLAVAALSLGMLVLGYVWAVVVSMGVALLWMQVGVWRHLKLHPADGPGRLRLIPAWRSYGRVMYGNSLLGFWTDPLDRTLLVVFAGPASVGVLMVAQRLYMLPGVFFQMFLSIVAPMMASAGSSKEHDEIQRIYHLTTDWVVRLSFPLISFLAVYAEPVLGLFGSQFAEQGTLLLRILLLAQLINLVSGPIGTVLNMCGEERRMLKINAAALFLKAALICALVPIIALPGLGIAVLGIMLVSNVSALLVAHKAFGVPWWNSRCKHWLIPALVTVVTTWAGCPHLRFTQWGLAGGLLLSYLVFHGSHLLVHGFNEDDQEVISVIRSKLGSIFASRG
ncbi:MAG: oligosaccharide flippase family protein [Akkermansiaceae bacterium]|nr:oligosaccharide flippase family protein [Akkermansiaceae bacterium]